MENMTVIYDQKIKRAIDNFAIQAISFVNALGLGVGLICINLADVILGGIMLSQAFEKADLIFGNPYDGWIIGFTISFSFLFIQLLLWMVVLRDGKITLNELPALLLSGVILIADTIIDIVPEWLWIDSSEIKNQLMSISLSNFNLFDVLLWCILTGSFVALGFSEMFNSLYIRTNGKHQKYPSKPDMKKVPSLPKNFNKGFHPGNKK